jgi:hypothetical protein
VSAFAYKYLALYLPTSPHLVRSCQLLERFWLAIRQLPSGDSANAAQAILSPYVILTCLKLFKRSDGATNLQFLFTIIPGFGSKRNSQLPWVEFISAVASFFNERLEEGADTDDDAVDGDDDDDDQDAFFQEGDFDDDEDGGYHEMDPLLNNTAYPEESEGDSADETNDENDDE